MTEPTPRLAATPTVSVPVSGSPRSSGLPVNPALERKVRVSQYALLFEQVWPRIWALIALIAIFFAVSWAGLWPALPELAHKLVLALFGLCALAILASMVRLNWPDRDAALVRMERSSGVPHRPASAYEDTLSLNAGDKSTVTVWQAHRERLGELRHGYFTEREPRQDGAARGIGKSREGGAEAVGRHGVHGRYEPFG
mgnify:CR=1 FL=1